jgi:hypothetical protein
MRRKENQFRLTISKNRKSSGSHKAPTTRWSGRGTHRRAAQLDTLDGAARVAVGEAANAFERRSIWRLLSLSVSGAV